MTIDTNVSMDLIGAVSIISYRVEGYGEEDFFIYENLIDNTRTNVDDYHSFKWTKVTQLPLWNVSNKHFNQILFVNVKVNNEDYNEVGFDYVNARLIATQEYEGVTLEGVENVKRSNIIS